MASNPMQRKARNAFLLGMFLMLIITGIIIAFLFLQIRNYQEKEKAQLALETTIYVLTQDVKSGQIITPDMLEERKVYSNVIPANAIGDIDTFENYSLQDKEGNTVSSKIENGKQKLYIRIDKKDEELKAEEVKGENGEINYYIEKNGEKQYIELNTIPVLAKVSMQANTVLTREFITKGYNTTTDDVRKQEYNIIVLPSQIQTGDYVDIRLSMPSGEDYIVISKKEITIPTIGDSDSEDTIWMNLTEQEILTMSSAFVDAARVPGSKLYATTYTEPGIQSAATPTYSVNAEVVELMKRNPNIVKEAMDVLDARYNNDQRNRINQNIQNNIETSDELLRSKVEESITKTQEQRKSYLDSLSE